MSFSSNAKSNEQNRALQKSSGMKLFQQFGTAAPVNTGKKRIDLLPHSLANAKRLKNRELTNTASVVFVVVTGSLLYIMQWLGVPVF